MPRREKSDSKDMKFARRVKLRTLIQLLVIGLLLYIVLAGFSGLSRSLHAIQSATIGLIIAAAIAVAVSYVAATVTYMLLAPKPVPFIPTLLIQISGGLVNRLLPGGLGGLGINALYLKKRGNTLPVATAVVAINNFLGFIGNGLLLAVTLSIVPLQVSVVHVQHISWRLLAFFMVIILLISFYLFKSKNLNRRLQSSLIEVSKYLLLAARRPGKSILALLSSCALTSLHSTALFLVMQSVGIDSSWAVALIAVSAGSIVGATIPTPGGLGGAEAGIAAALVAFHVSSADAVAVALIYRGLTYWVPLLPGYAALRVVEKRYL
jgi:uncharacterized protein (TIRG00374 family)